MRGRVSLRQRGAVHEPQLRAQPGARPRVHAHARPAPAHRGALRHAGHQRRGATHVTTTLTLLRPYSLLTEYRR